MAVNPYRSALSLDGTPATVLSLDGTAATIISLGAILVSADLPEGMSVASAMEATVGRSYRAELPSMTIAGPEGRFGAVPPTPAGRRLGFQDSKRAARTAAIPPSLRESRTLAL